MTTPTQDGTQRWMDDPAEVTRMIGEIESQRGGERFIATRYPYTYAYDYMRQHAQALGLPPQLSRADCSALIDGDRADEIVRLLADAYLREYHIIRPEADEPAGS